MADTEQPAPCTHHPKPGDRTDLPCATCGHHILLHVGVEQCPVCELVQHNQQAREASVTVHVEGRVIDEATLRDSVEKSMRRYGQGRA